MLLEDGVKFPCEMAVHWSQDLLLVQLLTLDVLGLSLDLTALLIYVFLWSFGITEKEIVARIADGRSLPSLYLPIENHILICYNSFYTYFNCENISFLKES